MVDDSEIREIEGEIECILEYLKEKQKDPYKNMNETNLRAELATQKAAVETKVDEIFSSESAEKRAQRKANLNKKYEKWEKHPEKK